MYRLRIISASILVPISVVFGYVGGPPFVLYALVVMTLAAWEYVQVLRHGQFRPSLPLVVGGTIALIVSAYLTAPAGRRHVQDLLHVTTGSWSDWALPITLILLFLAMTWHVLDHERGAPLTASDWAFTIAGALYLGLCAAHWVLMREDLGVDGRWWALVVLPSQWMGDSFAMLTGRRFGRHKLAPRLSPGKTWEGYVGGVISGALSGMAFALLAQFLAGLVGETTRVTWWAGLLVGGVCTALSPLGDLGESMIKRQVNVKDSSNLLPGHGGMLDRTDSQLWAAVIGYYFFVFFVLPKGG